MVKIAPSVLSADFSRLSDQLQSVEKGGADLIHVDVMDGHFVSNITFGPIIVSAIRKLTKLPLCVHLMISEPWRYANAFCDAGANYLTFHLETFSEKDLKGGLADSTINLIREKNVKPGLAINPETSGSEVFPFLNKVDLVLVMSVHPGFGGQGFIKEVLPKIREINRHRETRNFEIEVDGGVSLETAPGIVEAGGTMLAVGSYVFCSQDPASQVKILRRAVEGMESPK